jgi:hypothetical protein
MMGRFRGEAIYSAEVDVHFPQLTVGDTLAFAAEARAVSIFPLFLFLFLFLFPLPSGCGPGPGQIADFICVTAGVFSRDILLAGCRENSSQDT